MFLKIFESSDIRALCIVTQPYIFHSGPISSQDHYCHQCPHQSIISNILVSSTSIFKVTSVPQSLSSSKYCQQYSGVIKEYFQSHRSTTIIVLIKVLSAIYHQKVFSKFNTSVPGSLSSPPLSSLKSLPRWRWRGWLADIKYFFGIQTNTFLGFQTNTSTSITYSFCL